MTESNETNGVIVEISNAAELEAILASDSNVIIDFMAPWCGPCRVITAALLKLIAELKARGIIVVKVNTDKFGDIAARYNVRSLPTLVYVSKTGEVITTKVGGVDYLKLKSEIEAAFPASAV